MVKAKMIFMSALIIMPMMALSSKSWIMIWILLELVSMNFIMMIINSKTLFDEENSMKYFLIQSSASCILLISIMSYSNYEMKNMSMMMYMMIILSTAMAIKMAVAPFHSWMPALTKTMKWNIIMLMMSWQKLIPLMILMKNSMNKFIMLLAIISMLIGTTSQFNINSTKLIMAMSSVAHMGWMLIIMKSNNMIPLMYLMIYSMLIIIIMMNFNKMNFKNLMQQMTKKSKIYLMIMILSLAGIPPLMGFLPKWMVISIMTKNYNSILVLTLMIMLATMNFYIYIRLTSSPMMNQNSNSNLKKNKNDNNKMMNIMNMSLPMMMIFYPK